MFSPPPRQTAEIFARVPDHLRITGRTNRWIDVHRAGAPTDCFLEGPSFDLEGNLYLVDVAWGRIFRVSPEATFSVVTEYDGCPNGLKIHRDGRIFVADHQNGVLQLDPASGAMQIVADGFEGKPFNGVNDLVFARNGDLYFTDQGESGLHAPFGRLFRLRMDGTLECVISGVPSPNGLVLDLSENNVFLNVTRDNAVWRVPMVQGGRAVKVGAFIRLSGGVGPDGLAIDKAGNLAVAHFGFGAVWLFSARGEPLLRIDSPAGVATTNVAYGGPGNRHLYITESETGSVLRAEMPEPGKPMYSHANQ